MSIYNGMRPSNIRQENIKQIIRMFRSTNELYSRAQISRKLSLSAPSVSEIVSDLLKIGILFESEEGSSGSFGGRKPILLDINRECGYIIGVHIENEQITIVLTDILGEVKDKIVSEYSKDEDFDSIEFLIDWIKDVLKNNQIDIEKLLSIGVTLPGIFDNQEKRVKFAPNVSQWQKTPIKEILEEKFDCKVTIENAVNTAVLGEKWKGKIAGKDNAVYVKFDRGIGAGILIDGKIYKGVNNVAGEIGFLLTDKDHVPEHKDDFGALENYCGKDAIVNKARELTGDENLEFEMIVEKAKSGDQELYNLLDDIVVNIEMAISNISSIINPQIVVIGGAFVKMAPLFESKINDIIERSTAIPPRVVFSDLGERVYYLGVIVQALDNIEENIIEKVVIKNN